jgi:hypothetical protein
VSKFAQEYHMTRNQEIAKTILEQLGGGQFVAVTGAHGFVAIDNGLQFQLHAGAKDKINKVRIVLTPADEYNVIFYRTRGPVEPVLVATLDGLYFDQLQDVFEEHTGLYTTLKARK